MFLLNADGITIADLSMRESRCHGLKLSGIHNLLVHNVHFMNIGERAIKGTGGPVGNNGEVRYCIFENTKIPSATRAGAHDGGNYIAGMDMMVLDGWDIHDNVFMNIKGASGRARGSVFLWRDCRNCIVQRNVFIGNDKAIAFWETNTDMIIRNNFIVPGVECGISVNQATRLKVYNNTSFTSSLLYSGNFSFNNSTDCEVKNNIIYGGISVLGGAVPDTAKNITLLRAGRLTAAEWFVNEGEGDLHLKSDSLPDISGITPVNAGTTLSGVTVDWDNVPRSGAYDIGADEYDDGSFIDTRFQNQISRVKVTVWPNPFSTSVFFEIRNAKSELRDMQAAIYDVHGKLVHQFKNHGSHSAFRSSGFAWDASNQPGGIYFYRLNRDGYSVSASKMLIKLK
jgi:hypothetical protein